MMPTPVEDPNKAAFLERVRTALGRTQPILHTPDHPSLKATMPRQEEKVRTIQAKVIARRAQAVGRLVETASEASWSVHRADGPEQAAAIVADIAEHARVKNVIRSAEDIFKRVDIDASLRRKGVSPSVLASGRSRRRSDLKRMAFGADLGVTGVSYAIAETASCVVAPRKGVARMASLAPPVLVLLIDEEQVLETLDDFFAITRLQYQQNRGRSPNYYNFISGPSRTADIEQTLTIGVHGPGEVHMVLIAN
jgi:L-lactate dehydrogenase complex protein LldG